MVYKLFYGDYSTLATSENDVLIRFLKILFYVMKFYRMSVKICRFFDLEYIYSGWQIQTPVFQSGPVLNDDT